MLALPGVEYVGYFPRGGTNSLELAAGTYDMEWLHPETGRTFKALPVTVADGSRNFVPPTHPNDDWVLHLRRKD